MIYSVAAKKRELDVVLTQIDRMFVGVFELLGISIAPFVRREGFVDYVTESPHGRENLALCPIGHISDLGSTRCSVCGKSTREFRALSMCMHFVVGQQMADALDYTQWSGSGKIHPWLGTAGLGLGRALMQTVHVHRTDEGLGWPRGFEPIEIVVIPRSKSLHRIGEDVARVLTGLGYRVMLEDRKLSSNNARSLTFLGIPETLALVEVGSEILAKVIVNGEQSFEGDMTAALERYRALAIERLSALIPMPLARHAEAMHA